MTNCNSLRNQHIVRNAKRTGRKMDTVGAAITTTNLNRSLRGPEQRARLHFFATLRSGPTQEANAGDRSLLEFKERE